VGHALVYAIGVAVSPVAIAAVLVILGTRGASRRALIFAGGWILGIASCAAVFTLVVNAVNITDARPVWIGITELALGIAFVALAIGLWLRRRPEPEPSRPWIAAVDEFTSTRLATLGVVLSGGNPKVYALSLGAALSLAQAGANASTSAAAIGLFTAVGALGVVLPIAACAVFPQQGQARLATLRDQLTRYERVVLVVLTLLVGALFARDGLQSLTS
jgi:hypothetical protein